MLNNTSVLYIILGLNKESLFKPISTTINYYYQPHTSMITGA